MPDKAGVKVTASQAFLSGYYYWDEASNPREYIQEGSTYKFIERNSGTGDYDLVLASDDTQIYWTAGTYGTEPDGSTYNLGALGSGSILVKASPKFDLQLNLSSGLDSSELSGTCAIAGSISPAYEDPILVVNDTQSVFNGIYIQVGTYAGYPLYESERVVDSEGLGTIPEFTLIWSIGDADNNGKQDDDLNIGYIPPNKYLDNVNPGWRVCRTPQTIGQGYAPPEAVGLGNADPALATWNASSGSVLRVVSVTYLGQIYSTLSVTPPTPISAIVDLGSSLLDSNLTKYSQVNMLAEVEQGSSFDAFSEVKRLILAELNCQNYFYPNLVVARPVKTSIYGKTYFTITDNSFRINPAKIEAKLLEYTDIVSTISFLRLQIQASIKGSTALSGSIGVLSEMGTTQNGQVEIFEASSPGATLQQTRQTWVKNASLQNGDSLVSVVWNGGTPPRIDE